MRIAEMFAFFLGNRGRGTRW